MSVTSAWQLLGKRAPTDLVDARLQLHWAAQLVSAVGTTLLAPASDDSHTNLEWLADRRVLAGRLIGERLGYRAALRPADLSLFLLDERNAGVAEHRLHGWTFAEAMNWLAQEIAAFARRPLPKPLQRRALDLPDHPVARGAAFSIADAGAFVELGNWYANADAVLRGFAAPVPTASPVRCWPHHFDIATLVTVDGGGGPNGTRTIGVGLSPGDGSYTEPYWYVTPWPYPKDAQLPVLDGAGRWHRGDWLGAVLVGSQLVAQPTPAAQADQVQAFLRSAVAACREVIGNVG